MKLPLNQIILGDCLEVMKTLPDGCIDMVLCDLPFGLSAPQKFDDVLPFDKLWEQYLRVAKDNAAFVFNAIQPFATDLINSQRKLFRYDLVWHKKAGSGFLNANRMPLRNHELVLVFYKKLPIYHPQMTDGKYYKCKSKPVVGNYREQKSTVTETSQRHPTSVIEIVKVGNGSNKHYTQKPVELCEWLIKSYTNDGDVVLDNCCGSGSTLVAAARTARKFIGIEINPIHHITAVKRVLEE